MAVIRIPDEFSDFEWDGEVVAGPVSTELDSKGRHRARWFEATLYLKADGTYVLHQVNHSRVWHTEDGIGHVKKPEERDSAALGEHAVYCGDLPSRGGRPQCPSRVRRYVPPPARVIVEMPQHKVISFRDEAAVIREISVARKPDGTVSVAMSDPMRELLVEAAEKIPAFDTVHPVVAM